MSEERLQKILARAGIASRRKAEELIEEGRVTVNGQVAELGDKVDPRARRDQGRRPPRAARRRARPPLPPPQQAEEGDVHPLGSGRAQDRHRLRAADDAQGAGARRPPRLQHRRAPAADRRRRVRAARRPPPLRQHQDLRGQGQGAAHRGPARPPARRRHAGGEAHRAGEDHPPRPAAGAPPEGRARERQLLVDRRDRRGAHAPDPRDVLPDRPPRQQAPPRRHRPPAGHRPAVGALRELTRAGGPQS